MNSRVPEVGIRRFPDGKSMVSMAKTGRYGDQVIISLTEAETAELIGELTAKLGQIRMGEEMSGDDGSRGSGSHGAVYDDEEAAAANRR